MCAQPLIDGPEVIACSDCGEDDHETGSILCAHTADSCSSCGGYHDSFYDCEDDDED